MRQPVICEPIRTPIGRCGEMFKSLSADGGQGPAAVFERVASS